MTKLAKIALVGTAFSVLTIGLSFFTNPSVKAVPLASNVNVVNTTRNPVPIAAQGITNVSGTVGLASGSKVSVANSLNSSSKPVPLLTRDVNNSGLNPFTFDATCSSPNSCIASGTVPSTTANGGAVQTVVIDFVSALCDGLAMGITQDNFNFVVHLSGQNYAVFFPATVEQGEGRMAQQTAIYADPGSFASLGTPGNNTGCSMSVTGHLIPRV